MPRAEGASGDAVTFDRRAAGPADTMRLGRLFGISSPDGAVILLEGELGAGKTTFAQGVAEGCGVPDTISSPTYNLVLHHEGRRPLVHADLYRLASPEDLETLDLDEILSPPGLSVVEWPGLVVGRATPPWAVITLIREDGGRRVTGRLIGVGWSAVREAVEAGR